MTVPAAMEAQAAGTIGSLIKRRVTTNTTCIAFSQPRKTTAPTSEAAAEGFALRLTCNVTKYIRAGGRHGEEVVRTYCGGAGGRGAEATRDAVPDDEGGVRDALRGMLRSIRPLQDLGLTDGEWESIVPEDVVPKLTDPEERARYGGAEVSMAVEQRVRYDPARVLMTGCKEVVGGDDGAATAKAAGREGDGEAECSVCFDALLCGKMAVELPGCAHAFHRRCISKWFSRKPTSPLCRGDVVRHLDPDLQKYVTEFTDAAAQEYVM